MCVLLKQLIEEWIKNRIERALSGRENERKPGHQKVMEAALKVVLPNSLLTYHTLNPFS
jgi:hypothetical protein